MLRLTFLYRSVALLLATQAACSSNGSFDCAELNSESPREGVCETTGIVERPLGGSAQWLIMDNGKRGGIALHNHPEIESGDRVRIKADYYLHERYVDLADYISIERLNE